MIGFSKVVSALIAAAFLFPQPTSAEPPPPCLTVRGGQTIQATVLQTRPAPEELLARLVYAETQSTGFAEDERVHQAIAWGVMNRVRLGDASLAMRNRYGHGLSGVIFRKGQFNPAVSARSPFSRDFLCPRQEASWRSALQAARIALEGRDNPFIQTDWERRHQLALVVNFYYPHSPQAREPVAPWERSRELSFIGEIAVGGSPLPAERIRLYRLATPPRLSNP
ncbi:MAG: cell wall hydrolase [Candidatus Competibacteraceae bacterium]|nr:cell wall hydrolase [Candidatus Competibacteraceae bacterium]